MRIHIKTIPSKKQRYHTSGDYWGTMKKLQVRVSKCDRFEYEALVLIHELIEYFLKEQKGILNKTIDLFDQEMEKLREEKGFYAHRRVSGEIEPCIIDGKVNDDEPGICPEAPYHEQHMFAMDLEKQLCAKFGIDWEAYDKYFKL